MACFLSGCLRRGWSQGPVCTFGPRWILARSATVNAACFMSPAVLIFPAPSLIPLPYNIRSSKEKKKTKKNPESLRAAAFGISPMRVTLWRGEVPGRRRSFFFLISFFIFRPSGPQPPSPAHQSLNGHATAVTAAALKNASGSSGLKRDAVISYLPDGHGPLTFNYERVRQTGMRINKAQREKKKKKYKKKSRRPRSLLAAPLAARNVSKHDCMEEEGRGKVEARR